MSNQKQIELKWQPYQINRHQLLQNQEHFLSNQPNQQQRQKLDRFPHQHQNHRAHRLEDSSSHRAQLSALRPVLRSHRQAKEQQQQQCHQQRHQQLHSHRCQYFQYHFWCLLHVIFCLIDITSSLTMTEVKIPNHIMRFKTAVLGCRYSLDGESLYSVKWYKDGHEFYRYVPRDKPPGQVFPLPGVNVDLRNSTDTQVVLRRVTLMSTGLYRCEVSGEAPAFNTVSESETMTVVVTPTHGPKITGGQPRYQIGDVVRVNCSSAPSKPICHLSWLINGEPANRSYLRQHDKLIVGREGLEVARLGLEFRVRALHFKHGDMKLKCVAKISSLYWQSNEESVESDRQHRAPVLESRDSIAAKSHAHDLVLPAGPSGANSNSTSTLHITLLAALLHLTFRLNSSWAAPFSLR